MPSFSQSFTNSWSFVFWIILEIVHNYIPIVLTALADGALNPVLALCAMKEAIALLALMTLSHIVEHQGNLAPLIEVGSNLCTTLSLGIPERYEMMSAVPHMFFSTFTFIDLWLNWRQSVQNCFGDDPLYHLICPPLVISYAPLLIILIVPPWSFQMSPIDDPRWPPLVIPDVPWSSHLFPSYMSHLDHPRCPPLIIKMFPLDLSRCPPLIIPFAPVDHPSIIPTLITLHSPLQPPMWTSQIICLFYHFLFFPNFLIHSLPPFPFECNHCQLPHIFIIAWYFYSMFFKTVCEW